MGEGRPRRGRRAHAGRGMLTFRSGREDAATAATPEIPMSRLHTTFLRSTSVALAALALLGCTSTGQMTTQQREGVEMRRYCEQHPEDTVKCTGFLGFR